MNNSSKIFEDCCELLSSRYVSNINPTEDRPLVVVVLGAAASHPSVTIPWNEMVMPILNACHDKCGDYIIEELSERLSHVVGRPKANDSIRSVKKG